jgi:hypothetical protein
MSDIGFGHQEQPLLASTLAQGRIYREIGVDEKESSEKEVGSVSSRFDF